MTDWDAVRGVLAEDCAIKGRYINTEGETCAIGALALAAGVRKSSLVMAAGRSIHHKDPIMNRIRARITNKFGLTDSQLGDLQNTNDSYHISSVRRERVLFRTTLLQEAEERDSKGKVTTSG